ncbi:hypothetical protein KCU93_g598, partial [Aureobasidium melanogenum]
MHPSHQDLQTRGMYGQGYGFPQQMFAYPQYALHTHPAYATQPPPQSYAPVSPPGSAILMSQPTTSAVHSSPSQAITASPRTKVEPAHLKLEYPLMKTEPSYMQRPMSSIGTAPSVAAATSSPPSGTGTNTAAPGPIPATTPLVVRQDQNGVQWIAFEYSRDRVKMEYQIRCDVESVVIDDLTPEFKTANCVYPGAYSGKEGYKGNRLHYESECNAVGWALAHLNPALREKRGLIQRAVDSWRNSNQDPRLRSRRVRRQAKINNRKAQLRQSDGAVSLSPTDVLASRVPPAMSMDSTRPTTSLSLNGGQLHHHHSTSDASGGESVSNEAHPFLNHQSPSTSLALDSPLESHRRDSHCPTLSTSYSTGSESSFTNTKNFIKAEEEEKNPSLSALVPEGKKRKFILVDDLARGTRVRVHVELDNIKLEEMPDFHLQKNSVYPRQFYPRQMHAPSPGQKHLERHGFESKSENESIISEGESLVDVPLSDGSQTQLSVPEISRDLQAKECLVCRARKSKCTLDTTDGEPQPPCLRCRKENKQCVIGSSNRGGRRVRRSTIASQQAQGQPQASSQSQARPDQQTQKTPSNDESAQATSWNSTAMPSDPYSASSRHNITGATPLSTNTGVSNLDFVTQRQLFDPQNLAMDIDSTVGTATANDTRPHEQNNEESGRSSSSENIPFNDLQNPSDALDILAQIASNDNNSARQPAWQERQQNHGLRTNSLYSNNWNNDGLNYHLVRSGALSSTKISQLVERYRQHYHPYFSIAPPSTLDTNNLVNTAKDEPHLLTAMLVIASKDLMEEPQIFTACSAYMQSLVSALVAGGPGGVEAVESLLILAEWAPYTSRSRAGNVGRGEEDREAWMHVGTALRIGYYLGLDKYSFPVAGDIKDPQWKRKRLVWTCCYISDRQISIRIGRAFWSRGPGPGLAIRKEDYPYQPQNPGDEDFARLFQATLELTLLFSNVHDVLYSSPGNSLRNHLTGGYYIKIDFRSAYYGWNAVYGTMTCSPNLKAMLLMSYDYLRLYTNAFAFHATIRRALPEGENGKPSFSRVFYNNVGAVGDARFIYEGLDAAKSVLTTMNNFVDAERILRYMPLRFYLFTVYAGVFLYHARTVGVMAPEEEASVRRMIQQTVTVLQRSGVGESHPGSRYSQLLKLLWDKVDRKSHREPRSTRSLATLENPYRPVSNSAATPASNSAASASLESPAVADQMGDFSWTDLDAIGNFAVNGNEGMSTDAEWWTGFLPTDSGPLGPMSGLGSMDNWSFML